MRSIPAMVNWQERCQGKASIQHSAVSTQDQHRLSSMYSDYTLVLSSRAEAARRSGPPTSAGFALAGVIGPPKSRDLRLMSCQAIGLPHSAERSCHVAFFDSMS